MGENFEIDKPILFLVEGTHEVRFLKALLLKKGINLDSINIRDCGGKTGINEDIVFLPKAKGFKNLEALIIIRDADNDFIGAFDSIKEALQKIGIKFDKEAGECYVSGKKKIGIFIFPNNFDEGCLETLCMRSVTQDDLKDCVNQYMACISKIIYKHEEHPHYYKAWVQAYLAHHEKGNIHMGIAAESNVWDFNNPVFDKFMEFINQFI